MPTALGPSKNQALPALHSRLRIPPLALVSFTCAKPAHASAWSECSGPVPASSNDAFASFFILAHILKNAQHSECEGEQRKIGLENVVLENSTGNVAQANDAPALSQSRKGHWGLQWRVQGLHKKELPYFYPRGLNPRERAGRRAPRRRWLLRRCRAGH